MIGRAIDNYELLDLIGIIEHHDDFVKLSSDVVVLNDDGIPELKGLGRVFTIDKLFSEVIFTPEELKKALDTTPYLEKLRFFFAHFRPQADGRITQKADYWDKFKAWRFDVDYLYPEEHILSLIEKLPLKPNIIKRTNKGWHLIYVFDEFILRDNYELYKERFNNFSGVKDEKAYLHFIVYELLTNHIPSYLKSIEEKLDFNASSLVNMIATRFVSERLPAYLIREPYTLSEFYKAFKHLIKTSKDEKQKENGKPLTPEQITERFYEENKFSPYTVRDIPKETFYSLLSRCKVLEALEEAWENHSYEEWFIMTTYYAIKILYADTPEEKQKLIEEYHIKSRRHPTYDRATASYHLDYAIKKQSERLRPMGCGYIYANIRREFKKICEACSYKKVDKDGNIFGHFIFDALKEGSLEDPPLKGWELREDGWYYVNGDGFGVRVLPYFKIRTHYIVGDNEEEYVEIVDGYKRTHIKKVERRKDTYMPSLDLVKSYGFINPDKVKDARRFLAYYIERAKEKQSVKIDFLGYRYADGRWDIAVGGDGRYTRKELAFIFYGKDLDNSDWFIPSVRGNLETFKEIYRKLFSIEDPPLHFAIAHYLSWIGRQLLKDSEVWSDINPVLVFVGDTGTGKSIRAKISAGLYGNPALFSFTNITQASFNNNFPLIKTPFGIDEVITKAEKDEVKFGELIYNITNIQGKMTYSTTYNPIEVPVLITGETENLLIDKVLASFRGLNRRSIVVELTSDWKHNSKILGEAVRQLYYHYGHILSYVESLTEQDKRWIEEVAKNIYKYEKVQQFADANFEDLKKHIAMSLAMFAHFFLSFIQATTDTREIDRKLAKIIDFVVEQITRNQVGRVGENIDYVEEVLGFISKVEEAKVKGSELRGLSYKQVCQKIGYTPSHKVGEVLKKFFWKRYQLPNNGTRLVFTPSCLITYPVGLSKVDTSLPECINDKSRVENFTEEEARIWLEVLKIRHGEERAKQLIEALELDKVPVFKRVLNSTNEQTKPLIQEKPQAEDSKGKVVPISEAGKQSKAENTKPTNQTEQKETKRSKMDTPFNKPILKNQTKRAEPTYPYPENDNEDETIAGWMASEEEREWIKRNLKPLNDDFLDYF